MAPASTQDLEIQAVTDTSAVVIPDPVLSNGNTHPVYTIDDVLPHRSKSAPMPRGVATFGSADMFKSKAAFKKPVAKRWDYRISEESKARKPSSLKGAMKHFKPHTISLCGGLPSSDYFPFHNVGIKAPVAPAFSEQETNLTGRWYTAGKHDVMEDTSQYDLSIALNYGQSMGAPQFLRFLTEHNEIVHNPPYSDWDICLTVGSTAGLEMSLRLLLNRGMCLLTEEYSFSTAMETAAPMGINVLGVKMDVHGMLPDALDQLLSTWNSADHDGAPKPFLVYTVPTGQNPTSSTQPLERRKAIYAVAEKHDLYILEDEPYYFLQMEPYVSGTIRKVPSPFVPDTVSEFLKNITPSYLSLDTSGRVLRMDSFSKILAPGARSGWVTASSQIIERFIRHTEVSMQNPSGFSQIALYKLLEEAWGHKGFLEWLMYIRAEYSWRRDIIVSACEKYLPTEIASWEPPMAGMFHWIKVDITRHPKFVPAPAPPSSSSTTAVTTNGSSPTKPLISYDNLVEIEEAVFLRAAELGVLIARGSWFRAQKGTDTQLFFRTTFAAVSAENIEIAVERLGQALRLEFGLVENGNAPQALGKENVHANGHPVDLKGLKE